MIKRTLLNSQTDHNSLQKLFSFNGQPSENRSRSFVDSQQNQNQKQPRQKPRLRKIFQKSPVLRQKLTLSPSKNQNKSDLQINTPPRKVQESTMQFDTSNKKKTKFSYPNQLLLRDRQIKIMKIEMEQYYRRQALNRENYRLMAGLLKNKRIDQDTLNDSFCPKDKQERFQQLLSPFSVEEKDKINEQREKPSAQKTQIVATLIKVGDRNENKDKAIDEYIKKARTSRTHHKNTLQRESFVNTGYLCNRTNSLYREEQQRKDQLSAINKKTQYIYKMQHFFNLKHYNQKYGQRLRRKQAWF